MKLEEIGFYTLYDKRAKETSWNSQLKRCELILTDRCNFNCKYCRGVEKKYSGDISLYEAYEVVDIWASGNLENIRFSGGEPTLWPNLLDLIHYTKAKKSIKRIALSTNGSAELSFYKELHYAGVNDFSISLDACCSINSDKMAGCNSNFYNIVNVIKEMSKLTYVTAGIVLDEKNNNDIDNIIKFASDMGVSDIRIIPSAQSDHRLNPNAKINKKILSYRMNNINNGRHVRGINYSDCNKCYLVKDDMAIMKGYHFPCIIYMREQGEPIGSVYGKSLKQIRDERKSWFKNHNTHNHKICKKNCLDVCIDYNNRVECLQND